MSLSSAPFSDEVIEPLVPTRRETGVALKWEWHLRTLIRLRTRLKQTKKRPVRGPAPRANDDESERRIEEEKNFEVLFAAVQTEKSPLVELDTALDRLQLGGYGICEKSGYVIPDFRLRSMPWVRTR